MLTRQGIDVLLKRLCTGPAWSARFVIAGEPRPTLYPVDAGYPRLGDQDLANDGRGEHVMTWRITVPRGTSWGSTPAREVELVDEHGTVTFHDAIEPFRVSQSHPSILFLNLMVER